MSAPDLMAVCKQQIERIATLQDQLTDSENARLCHASVVLELASKTIALEDALRRIRDITAIDVGNGNITAHNIARGIVGEK